MRRVGLRLWVAPGIAIEVGHAAGTNGTWELDYGLEVVAGFGFEVGFGLGYYAQEVDYDWN